MKKNSSTTIANQKNQLATNRGEQEHLRERFLFAIEMWAADKYRYEWLENRTGIPAARWQNVLLEKQFPTLEMLIAVCKHRPDYTYWLMHGTQEKWIREDAKNPSYKLEGPAEEILNKFKTDREWIKERRKANMATKKPPTNP